jgi:hypothetical integral membrane protein (TIGR02206 family)
MPSPFPTFGPAHLALLAAVPLAAAALAAVARRRPASTPRLRRALAAVIGAAALAGLAPLATGAVRVPHGLPLELCDVVEWVAVYALLAARPWALEVTWFLGLAGSGMALLTPDVGAELGAWSAPQFFVAHGGVIVAALFLAGAGALRPRPGAWLRVFVGLNVYAAAVALFDALLGTNYMYLREKPSSASLLDLLGPWPWYVLAAEPVALLLLLALDLPFRRARAGGRADPPPAGPAARLTGRPS